MLLRLIKWRVALNWWDQMGDSLHMDFTRNLRWDLQRFRIGAQALLALALAAQAARGQSDVAVDKSKLLTPEASLNLRAISDLQYSPDGTRLAFVVMEPPKG